VGWAQPYSAQGVLARKEVETLTNRNRTKGTAAESAVVDYLIENGWPHCERRSLAGNQDRGDIAGLPGVVIEVKNHASLELAQWLDEALREGRNANASVAVVWHHRRGKSNPAQWYVTMQGEQFVKLLKDDH
jgi:hypothetical protein